MFTELYNFDFAKLYADTEQAKTRYNLAYVEFEKHFGPKSSWQNSHKLSVITAPGRTEVGGNHTDHQHGCVLAGAINLDVVCFAKPNNSDLIRVVSNGFGIIEVEIANIAANNSTDDTSSLISGIVDWFIKNGKNVGGFDAYVFSDVLVGSGLSSSAAFEVAIGNVLNTLFNDLSISPVKLAIAGQYSENNFMHKPSGLMDQMASAVGGFVAIDFKDPQNPIINQVNFDIQKANYSLCITDTKGSHAGLTDAYASMPREMKMVAQYFKKDVLRQVDESEFYLNLVQIRQQVGDRPVLRAIHYFNDNKRAQLEAELLQKNDFPQFLKTVRKSGNSSYKYLQNIYANYDEQAISLAIAISEKVFEDAKENNIKYPGAVRVHGGGYAGTIQAFVHNDLVSKYSQSLDAVFGKGSCKVLSIRADGVTAWTE